MKFEWVGTPDGDMVRGVERSYRILLSKQDIRELNEFLKHDPDTLTPEDIDFLCAWEITPKDEDDYSNKEYRPNFLGC